MAAQVGEIAHENGVYFLLEDENVGRQMRGLDGIAGAPGINLYNTATIAYKNAISVLQQPAF